MYNLSNYKYYNLGLKFLNYFIVLLFFSANNYPITYAKNLENDVKEKYSLGIDYLKNVPDYNYRVGPGDTLRIIVSRDYPELTSYSIVDGEGTIYLPKLNRIYIRHLSVNELSEILNKAYKEFVKYPSVEVEVERYRPIRVFLEGEVVNPGFHKLSGSYPLINQSDEIQLKDLQLNSQINSQLNARISNGNNFSNHFFPTVFDAIRASGGITNYSDLSNIQVIRKSNLSDGDTLMTTNLNLEDTIISGDPTQNIRIYDGDIIKIKKTDKIDNVIFNKATFSNINPKFLNVSVFGRVKAPGRIALSRSGTLNDAIQIAGGARVLKGKLTLLSFKNNGTIEKKQFRYKKNAKRGSSRNPYLSEGDLIVIGDSLFSTSAEVLNEVLSPFAGIVSAYSIYQVFSD